MISLHDGKGAASPAVVEKLFWVRCVVAGCQPRIWRRLAVRDTMWLSRLHDAIQVAFDWYDYQTHVFTVDDLRLGNPTKREDLLIEDDRDLTLADLNLASRERLEYLYEFGEGWNVEIRVEKSALPEKGKRYPICLAGERAGPPEDCGGIEAFHDMLASLREPDSDLGKEWRKWVGPEYDPAACDLE
jgi:hypothetical protein